VCVSKFKLIKVWSVEVEAKSPVSHAKMLRLALLMSVNSTAVGF
jgi:hypothetical protein